MNNEVALIITKTKAEGQLKGYSTILIHDDDYPYTINLKSVGNGDFAMNWSCLENIEKIIRAAYNFGKHGYELEIIRSTEED